MQVAEIPKKEVRHEKQVLKKFWDSLKNGKIVTLRCASCGTYMFPPVPICRECLSRDLHWVELSGEAEVLYFTSSPMPAKPFLEFAPYAYGGVRFKEGPIFLTRIDGVDISSTAALLKEFERLPIPVKAEITQVNGLNTVTFRAVR
jgi:uncharacterized OB-fold protein